MRTYKDLALAEEEQKLEEAIEKSRNLLIEAPTGSGKSLYIPWFLSRHFSGRIVVLQPRRIAALALAQYSAKLHNEPCGKTVGYQFRQDSCKSSETRILFQTYGNFLQELLHGKLDADWVVFDEYHERRADMDLLFAYFNGRFPLKAGMTPPRIAVMSAALNRDELEAALGVKCLQLGHPLYPVQIPQQHLANDSRLFAGQSRNRKMPHGSKRSSRSERRRIPGTVRWSRPRNARPHFRRNGTAKSHLHDEHRGNIHHSAERHGCCR